MFNISSNRFLPAFSLLETALPKAGSFKLNIQEEENSYSIFAELPGYDKNNIEVRVEKGMVTITAAKSEEKNEDTANYIYRESYYGTVSRQIAFKDIDETLAEAKYENGILTVNVPKKESARERKIEIK